MQRQSAWLVVVAHWLSLEVAELGPCTYVYAYPIRTYLQNTRIGAPHTTNHGAVLGGVTIDDRAVVVSGAVVTHDVSLDHQAARCRPCSPARPIRPPEYRGSSGPL